MKKISKKRLIELGFEAEGSKYWKGYVFIEVSGLAKLPNTKLR